MARKKKTLTKEEGDDRENEEKDRFAFAKPRERGGGRRDREEEGEFAPAVGNERDTHAEARKTRAVARVRETGRRGGDDSFEPRPSFVACWPAGSWNPVAGDFSSLRLLTVVRVPRSFVPFARVYRSR